MLPALIVLVAAVVGSSSMVAVLGWFWYRIHGLETARELQTAQMREAMADLEDVRGRMGELAERVEFYQTLVEGRRPDGRDDGPLLRAGGDDGG